MDITKYIRQLRKLYPTAVITAHMEVTGVKYEIKFPNKISDKEHEESMDGIRQIFGDTLSERYTEETGKHFYIYQKAHSQSVEN